MTRRVIHWISNFVRDPYTEPQPHFHQGPESTPAVCYDACCRSPHLDVGNGPHRDQRLTDLEHRRRVAA